MVYNSYIGAENASNLKKEYIMTYSTKTVKELQELRNILNKNSTSTKKNMVDIEGDLEAVCEELKLRCEQQKEKLKNLCDQLAK